MDERRKQVEKVFERRTVAEIIPSKSALVDHMVAKKPFHMYLGVDPTAKQLHLGHIQNILFLEDMRNLGAKVTLLFGSFTGLVGDPSGKNTARPQLTKADIYENMRSWKKQISPVLNLSFFGGTQILYNSRWFDAFSLEDFLKIARETTVQQLLERDMFQKRMDEGKPLYTHEMMYPLLQGYDSVAMKVDGELCGTDQTFNALMGRTMVKRYLDKEKFIIAMDLIQADGVMMSKSAGTGVFVDMETDGNHRMFGSIMALPDGFIDPLFRGCTRVSMQEIQEMELSGGRTTRDAKLRLAREVVSMFWGVRSAKKAESAYITQFREKEVPENAPVVKVGDSASILAIVAQCADLSKSEARRKITQGAVSLDGKKIMDINHTLKGVEVETVLRIGRRVFKIQKQ